MYRFARILALSLGIGGLALAGCSPKAAPTIDANTVYTQAAGTVQAELTRVAALTPSPTATTAATATTAPTDTPVPTDASQVTVTVQPTVALPTAAPSSPDKASWQSQTPADGTSFNPGDKFNMTWKVKNTGTSTWSTKYLLRFYAGDQMAGPATSAFPKDVAPNDTVELTVALTAPSSAGKYLGNWVLTNADGVNFYPVTIQISVANAPTATNTSAATATHTATSAATSVPSATPTP